ncbi:MAG TPA: hypothetical protein VMG12_08945 [Polyangiaceae bacterium]|nr:hypothetical protein [Polyangiaceae bacterium]
MRRGRACALGILLISCSPGGDDGSEIGIAQGGGNGAGAAPPAPGTGGTTNDPSGVTGGSSGDIFGGDVGCTNGCAFGSEPLLDANVQLSDVAPFDGDATFAPGVCVVEPQLSTATTPGTLFPRKWLRPRFRWTGSGSETLWEIRLSNPDQPDTLRAYTRDTQWLLPQAIWDRMSDLSKPTTVTIRGIGPNGITGAQGDFSIAPAEAGGSMVFWATTSSLVTTTSSRLLGFAVGSEGVVPALSAVDVQTDAIPSENGAVPRGFYACGDPAAATPRRTCTGPDDLQSCCDPTGFELGQVECVGCHVSTPDGKAVIFTDNWPWNKVAASIEPGLTGSLPATVTPYAANMMKQPWLGMQALSPAHFSTAVGGERILITSYGVRANPGTTPFSDAQPTLHTLAWFNLAAEDPDPLTTFPEIFPEDNPYGETLGQRQREVGSALNTAWGMLSTAGEPRNAVTPTWSTDGEEIAYVSTDVASTDGHPDWKANVADIMTVQYNNRAGGVVSALAGASDPNFLEYYPEFSADDKFVAFARAPNPSVANRCMRTQDNSGAITNSCAGQNLGENPDGPYYNRNGEIYIVPRGGGQAIRLTANDPVSCTNETARGSINSWPRWSPRAVVSDNGNTYYFLIFSSARGYPGSFALPKARLTPDVSNKSSQLYMAPIVVDANGQVTTYPAIYLWNQNILVDGAGNGTIQQTSNLTPAWDDFSIPEVPPVIQVPR